MIIDAIVAALLVITIGYCWRLSKRLTVLTASRKELHGLIKDFNLSVERANASITVLKALSSETDSHLKEHIEKARFLANDLAFLTHKGGNIANKLEEYIADSRKVDPNPMGLKSTGKELLDKQGAEPTTAQGENADWKFVDKRPNKRSVKSPEMPPSKQKALDTALAQIASRKQTKSPQSRGAGAITPRKKNRDEAIGTPEGIPDIRGKVHNLSSSVEIES